MTVQFTIPLAPCTKKNHQEIMINWSTGRPFVMPSKQYRQYVADCAFFIKRLDAPIEYPVNVKAVYYMPTKRKVDLCNLHACLHDVLVHYGILADDNSNIIVSTDGSRVMYDKDNPRTELEVEAL